MILLEENVLPTSSELLDSKGAAQFLGISGRTLSRYTQARKIAYIKYDGKRMFRRSALKSFQQKRLVTAQ
jgi:predicted site-specific integrase-resolvase